MILGQIEWSDCFVFVLALIPHLIIQAPWIDLAKCAFTAVPYLSMYDVHDNRHLGTK